MPPVSLEPALSVLIPCTRPQAVEDVLGALQCQSKELQTNVEAFVAGDVSPRVENRGTLRVEWLSCAVRHPNVRRNRALARAGSARVAFLDDDAAPAPGWLAAAISLETAGTEILVGPEDPPPGGSWRKIIFALCGNPFVEYSRGHTRRPPGPLAWYHAPFCNMVIPRKLLDEIGPPSEQVPWDMDDVEFCFRAGRKAVFRHDPSLKVFHDRYPDSPLAFLRYRWRQRVRLGEKIITHFSYYRRIPMAMAAAFAPWLAAATLALSPFFSWVAGVKLFAVCYAVFLAFQALSGYRTAKFRVGLAFIALTVCLHAIALVGVQYGLLRGFLGLEMERPPP